METKKEPTYAVPLDAATQWTTNWIDANTDGKTLDPTDMRAFLVHRKDFIELLKQSDTEYVRLYLGRRPDPSAGGQLRACLLMVSATEQKNVDPNSKDPDKIVDLVGEVTVFGTNGDAQTSETFDYEVYDFSRVCPPLCDDSSPLFIGDPDERCA